MSSSVVGSPALQTHLQVLQREGLIGAEEAVAIDSFMQLCPRDLNDEKTGVVDIITQMVIEHESDIVRLSDGRCYSKESLLEFLATGTVPFEEVRNPVTGALTGNKIYHPPKLPTTGLSIQDKDYAILGVDPPTEEEKQRAISRSIRVQADSSVANTDDDAQRELRQRFDLWKANAPNAPRARAEFIQFAHGDTSLLQRLAQELNVPLEQLNATANEAQQVARAELQDAIASQRNVLHLLEELLRSTSTQIDVNHPWYAALHADKARREAEIRDLEQRLERLR